MAPEIEVRTADGKTVSLSDFRGKNVVLARDYGVYDKTKRRAARETFVIDTNGGIKGIFTLDLTDLRIITTA
jgi:peroxiredoxin